MSKKILMIAALTAFVGVAAPELAHAQIGVRVTVPEIRVRVAPPPVRVEVQPARPSPNQNWVPGYWAWRGNRHEWQPGYWAAAPHAGMVWEPARWTPRGHEYLFVEGHWRWDTAPSPTAYYEPEPYTNEVVVERAPPRQIVEVRPARPFNGAVWQAGYWDWNGGRHNWVAGRWSAPRAGYRWESNRWEHGRDGHYRFRPGSWAAEQHRREERREDRHEDRREDRHEDRHDNGHHDNGHHGH